MATKNNFNNAKVRDAAPVRLFIKYKPEFASVHNAYNGDIKYHYPFQKKGGYDIEGMIDRICNQQRTHYQFAWIFNNGGNGFADVLRAWDKDGRELTPNEVQILNRRRKNKIERSKR